jgi:RimJ/RimL family protein N-acetyltransferase/diadenosine tetraphosphate (Ap4A) HIT family hydrolase
MTDPIRTERLVLREPEARDRTAVIDLFTSPDVGTYIGGPRDRDELERAVPESPEKRPGLFVVDLGGQMIGLVTLDPRDPDRPGAASTELGYLFLPTSWGHGYAVEACAGALNWFATTRPGEAVALTTQTANARSLRLAEKLGFTEVTRFHEYDAEQWLGVWSAPHYRGTDFYCDVAIPDPSRLNVVHEDELVLAFHHTRPFWETHIVIVPKQHIASFTTVDSSDEQVVRRLFEVVQSIAGETERTTGAAAVLTNLGEYQDSKHLHIHVHSGPLR